MTFETGKFFLMYAVYIVGIFCGIWLIVIANSDDEESDFQPGDRWWTFIYTFQVFVGSSDFSGVVDQKIAHA